MIIDAVADLSREVEEHARAERLAVPVLQLELPIVNRRADATKEHTKRRLILPAGVEVPHAGGTNRVDRCADCRLQCARRN